MTPSPGISQFLDQVRSDWKNSKDQFPKNTTPKSQKPIPFFGSPDTAIVATVGVNPSSNEFEESRGWAEATTLAQWKSRLYGYFNHQVPADDWFDPWRIGLALLGVSYEHGTAAHLDVSYRSTTAMLKNPRTDPDEFRRMVEQDAALFFQLLPLCPNLRVLLTFGPMVGETRGRLEGLLGFLFTIAPKHGFKTLKDQGLWKLWHEPTNRVFVVHDADTRTDKCITCRVVKNLFENRDALRASLSSPAPAL